MKPAEPLTDAELVALLCRAAAMADAPSKLIQGANSAWPSAQGPVKAATRLLAAALRFDSWAGAPLAFGMRALPADTRHLLFSAMGRDIDLRITPDAQHFALAGQILGPDESGRAELRAPPGGRELERIAAIDELGEFRLDAIECGTYLLTLRLGGDEIVLPPIEVGARRG
jgi:hypothetical protein